MIVSGIHIEKLTISHTISSTESMMTSFFFGFIFQNDNDHIHMIRVQTGNKLQLGQTILRYILTTLKVTGQLLHVNP